MTEQPPVPAIYGADATVEQLHADARADYQAAHPPQPDAGTVAIDLDEIEEANG